MKKIVAKIILVVAAILLVAMYASVFDPIPIAIIKGVMVVGGIGAVAWAVYVLGINSDL